MKNYSKYIRQKLYAYAIIGRRQCGDALFFLVVIFLMG
jgi:hypothetical protein